ncbi:MULTISPECIES: hypothetical protein [unclassified Flavobacterium]|uniref:hypothetical protein n=1 Tax=unclassified Flavobacterium TaxID=196869 RepID=UPI0012926B98|nr:MULTISPECIES: hypothetical protein [unclassified Flavobacterium]MQP53597.1 hypothetical protein [Flavobacterium sp. LMO9]MQP62255.1 hypothetical protein [Flavobacterium sp. LMO6]
MKKVIIIAVLSLGLLSMNIISLKQTNAIIKEEAVSEKFDIKIKNDTGNEVKVINAGSGGSYSLSKGATTTIKMEEGDKLHYYEKGKKGALILTASKDMHNKVQLLSKL